MGQAGRGGTRDHGIPQRQLQAKVNWCHRIQAQIDELTGFTAQLKDAYKELTGQLYQQRSTKGKSVAADDNTVAEALAILGKSVEAAD